MLYVRIVTSEGVELQSGSSEHKVFQQPALTTADLKHLFFGT